MASSLEARVRAAAKKKSNTQCFFSGEVNANYAVLWEPQGMAVFCCEKVVNQLRELNIAGLRVKGVSMAVFSEREAELMEVRGATPRGRRRAHVRDQRTGRCSTRPPRSHAHTHIPCHPPPHHSCAATRRSVPRGGPSLTPRRGRA
jgi:hypothetical protein